MPMRINFRELGVAPATLLEYLEGESSEIESYSQLAWGERDLFFQQMMTTI